MPMFSRAWKIRTAATLGTAGFLLVSTAIAFSEENAAFDAAAALFPAERAVAASAADPAALPSLESIGAKTDITAFLHTGVTPELRLAALRRAWTMDPTIRDFRGLQENDWDFNDPSRIFGFGELGEEIDSTQMLAQLFSDAPHLEARPLRLSHRIADAFVFYIANRL